MPHRECEQMLHTVSMWSIHGTGWTEEDLPLLDTIDLKELVHGHNFVEGILQYVFPGTLECCPVIDDLLPERPLEALAKGASEGVRLIIGTNKHEGSMFVRPEGTVFPNSWTMIREMFRRQGHGDAYEKVKEYYSRPIHTEEYMTPFISFGGDYAFQMPPTKAAIAHSRYADTRMFRYEYLSGGGISSGLMVGHGMELPKRPVMNALWSR